MLIKLLSYNIHKGFDWNNRNYFINEIKEFITQSQADIVFLQEVVGKNNKYQKLGIIDSQFEFLADQIWPHFSYGKNALYDHGHHGNLILSKFPIETYSNINISTNIWEKRGLLLCKINLPLENNTNHFIYAACSHLNLFQNGRTKQFFKIKEHIDNLALDKSTPFIMAGDFNDWKKESVEVFENELKMKEVYKTINGHYAKTFPAFFPLLCLDRIYIKNAISLSAKTITQKHISHNFHLSDHLPLICEIEINEK